MRPKMKGFVIHLYLFVVACCLATAIQAGKTRAEYFQVTPVSGIASVVFSGGRAEIEASHGICKFLLELEPGNSPVELYFFYAPDRPFVAIEGIQVYDNTSGKSLDSDALQASGRLTSEKGMIRLHNDLRGIDWQVQVIDYYR